MRKYISLIALLLCVQVLFAVDPSVTLTTYYAGINGKATDSKDALRVQLCTIISTGYVSTSYSNLKDQMYAASSNPTDFVNGSGSTKTMEDIYSSYPYTASQNGSSATNCGQGWNKEHTVPQSYFNEASPMVSDAHHVFPTDIRMNSCRSNYPYGENNAAKYCGSYGYGHLGTSTFSGYTGTVFDPGTKEECGGESYRGDLARVYFYMVTRYRTTNFTQDNQHNGAISFTYSNGVADLTDYMKNLMLKWHREDPVSEKELKRNNAIYAHQHNRNPFVDYPCLVEYIWGEHKGEAVNLSELISGYSGEGTDCCSGGSTPAVTYSVSWMANGSSFATSTTRPDDPNNCSDTRVFRGWTGTKNYSGDNAPLDLFTTGNPTITKDTTFYAVYADKSTEVSETPDTTKFVFAEKGYTNQQVVDSAKQGDVAITFDKGTNSNAPKYYTSGSAIRCYGGNTITVTATGMTKIVFTFGSSDGSNAITSNVGTFETNTWEGSANEVVFTIDGTSGHRRIAKIDVVIGSGSTTTYSNFSLSCSNSTPTDEAFPGAAPEGYYDAIEGLSDSILKSTLGALTYANFKTRYSYGSGNHNTWHALWSTDRDESDNSVIDMYSNNKRYFNPSDTTASVAGCDIEHMFPNSWWGGKAGNRDAYEDLHHLVPADYSANRSKSNHGPGEPTTITFNNGVWINGNDANRGNIVVFCPSDEYKGDFARAFFYIATTYGDTAVWQKEGITAGHHMTNDSWKEFLPEMSELLLKWHRQDPVSDKERIRMNKVYEIQGNRNPFIDYPCLAEYIWGEKQGQTVSLSSMASAYDAGFFDEGCVATTDPTIIDPTAAQYIGITKADSAITKQIKVRGINLTSGNLTLTLSGANASLFSLSANSISSTDAAKGKVVTITYTPTSNGEHSATLTISGCGVTSHEINLTATCSNLYTATWKVEDEQVLQTKAFSGQIPSLSDEPADCNANRVFVGWTAQTSVTDLPADLFRDEAPSLTENKTFYAVFADEDKHLDTKGSESYTFSSKYWAATPENWVSGKEAYQYSNTLHGVQVSKAYSGAYATAPITFTNVDTIKVNYCTNASSGAGSITMYVGEESITKTVDKTGGATLREVLFDFAATRPSGEVVISVECTDGSIYINSVMISYCNPPTYSNYRLKCSDVPQYNITFNNNGVKTTTKEDSGTKLSVSDPTPCEGIEKTYTFVGWSTAAVTSATTTQPTPLYASNDLPLVTADVTYYAVYSYSETTPGSPGAAVGATLWAEDFSGFNANDVPSSETPGTPMVYGGGNVTYSCSNGTGNGTTKIYAETLSGGTSPEILIAKNNGYFAISGIPTGNAEEMTLTIKTNKTKSYCLVSSSTEGITIGTQTVTDGVSMCDISNTGGVANFDLTITNTVGTNGREDDFLLVVKTAGGTPDVTITYYTTAPDCEPVVQPEYTVIFMDRGEKFYEATGVAGYSFSLPSMTDECTAHNFYGWSGLQYEEHNIDIPSIEDYPTTIPSHDTTYYAVYSKTTNSMSVPTNNYKKITTADELTSAKYLVVADTSELVAMSSELSGYYPIGVEVTANNADVITTENSAIIWRITVDGSQLTLYNTDKGYLYIEQSGTYYNIQFGNNTTNNKFTYLVNEDASCVFTSVTYDDEQLEYYQSKGCWTFFTSQGAPIYLYKQQLTSGLLTFYSTNPTCQAGPMTDIDTNPTPVEVRKLLIHGQLFILVGDQLFDITGKRVR